MFVDTHLHIDELGNATEVVEQSVAAGVTRLIAVGVNLERSSNAVSPPSSPLTAKAGSASVDTARRWPRPTTT